MAWIECAGELLLVAVKVQLCPREGGWPAPGTQHLPSRDGFTYRPVFGQSADLEVWIHDGVNSVLLEPVMDTVCDIVPVMRTVQVQLGLKKKTNL